MERASGRLLDVRDLRVGVVGRIVRGRSEVGRLVEVVDDSESTGGYLIVTRSADHPSETFDSWVESIVDVQSYFDELRWEIEWF
jgi:hypothetical protein